MCYVCVVVVVEVEICFCDVWCWWIDVVGYV